MNIIQLPEKPDELKKHLEQFKSRLPLVLEFAEIEAQITRRKYQALIANGFTEQQALELCKKP